jgi:hypothetical protein
VNLSPPADREAETEATFAADLRRFSDLMPPAFTDDIPLSPWQRLQAWRDELAVCWRLKPRERRGWISRLIDDYRTNIKVGRLNERIRRLGSEGERLARHIMRDFSRLGFGPAEAKHLAGLFVGSGEAKARDSIKPADYRPFEDVLCRTWQVAPLMRVCRNRDCRHSRFFIAQQRTQKYCSPECAKPAKRAAKLKWWRQKGTKRRKEKTQSRKRGTGHA